MSSWANMYFGMDQRSLRNLTAKKVMAPIQTIKTQNEPGEARTKKISRCAGYQEWRHWEQ